MLLASQGLILAGAHVRPPLLCRYQPCREWLWQVLPAGMHAAAPSSEAGRLQPAGPDSPQRGGGAARPAAHAAAPVQRMYVKALAAEVRLATALSCERG